MLHKNHNCTKYEQLVFRMAVFLILLYERDHFSPLQILERFFCEKEINLASFQIQIHINDSHKMKKTYWLNCK
jgi:hypothetical protein